MTRSHLAISSVTLVAIVAALAYLRDPPWLIGISSGLARWQIDSPGVRYRWMSGHASFFVPSDAGVVEIPLRATFPSPGDWPIAATISIDDRVADRIVFTDETWRTSVLRLPPPARRRVRRIDIRADRTRPDNHSLQVGQVRLENP